MKKSNTILVSCAAVAGVAAIVGVVVAVLGFLKASEARENTASSGSSMRKIYDADPFPNASNIDTAKTNAMRHAAWADALAKAIDEGHIAAARNVSPGAFSQMREKAIERMTAAAPKGEGGASILPENFAFGFDRYSSGVPAEKKHVERLVRQLATMEKLIGVIYDAGIVHLDAVGREEFEDAADDEDDDAGPRRRRGGGGSSGANSISVPAQPKIEGKVPLQRDRFAFQFSAKEAALVSILDSLATMQPYAMVAELSIKNIGEKVLFADENAAEHAASGDGGASDDGGRRRRRRNRTGAEAEADRPAAQPSGAVVLNERPAPRSARLVSGALRESPVQVSIVVDVCSVPSARKASGAEANALRANSEEED